jgi:hypothetical protein
MAKVIHVEVALHFDDDMSEEEINHVLENVDYKFINRETSEEVYSENLNWDMGDLDEY